MSISSFTIVGQIAIGYIRAIEGAVVIELHDTRSYSPYLINTTVEYKTSLPIIICRTSDLLYKSQKRRYLI